MNSRHLVICLSPFQGALYLNVSTIHRPQQHLAQCSLKTGRALKGMTTQPMGPNMTQYPHHLPVSCHTKLICNTDTELSLRKSMGRMHLNSFRQYVSAYTMSCLFIHKGIFSLNYYFLPKVRSEVQETGVCTLQKVIINIPCCGEPFCLIRCWWW